MTTSFTFIIRLLCITILFLSGKMASAQNAPLTFLNYGAPIVSPGGDTIYSSKIHMIIINPDSTYDFWSMPLPASCITWRSYKGRWQKEKDTIIFSNQYAVKKEMVYRTTKGIIQNNTLTIILTDKTQTTLPDYYKNLEFENSYPLSK